MTPGEAGSALLAHVRQAHGGGDPLLDGLCAVCTRLGDQFEEAVTDGGGKPQWLGPEPCHECGQEYGGDLVAWCPECGEVVCEDCQPEHEGACWPPDEADSVPEAPAVVKAKRGKRAVSAQTLPLPL